MDAHFNAEFCLPGFQKTSAEKRAKILHCAIAGFARDGYTAASINQIAREAGISIGALYSYFKSKEELFLYVADQGHRLLNQAVSEIDLAAADFPAKIRRIFEVAIDYTLSYPELTRIYLSLSSVAQLEQVERLNQYLESSFIDFYRDLFLNAKASGAISQEVDPQLAAFALDNMVVMLQHSLCSPYYAERMRRYLGEDVAQDRQALSQKCAEGFLRSFTA